MIKISEDLKVENIEIKDIMDIDLLQKFQDNFAISMDIASVTVDINGNPITKPSCYTSFCQGLTHSTSIGDKRCAESHKKGGEEAARTGRPYIYTCHAGLIDFAAPIMVDGKQIGTILGGQVLTALPEVSKYKKIANEIGVNEEEYVEAVRKVKITTERNIKAGAEVLFIFANELSKVGYEQLKLIKSMSKELSINFNQISSAMQELASTSISVTNNQHTLNEQIVNVQKISVEINTVMDSIKSIADKTNILGINAAIESARAGEAGRGFGVVAKEIRTLSQSSKETARQIVELTSKIKESVNKTLEDSKSILENTEQQSAAIEETNASIEEVFSLVEKLNSLANSK